MLDGVVEGARGAGADVEKVVLKEFGFKPCLNCGGCSKTGRCVLKDEYRDLNDKIRAADRLILASPIYMGSLSAQMKCLVDRGQPFWSEKFLLRRERESGEFERRALFVSCGGFKKGDKFLANAGQIIKIYLLCAGFTHAGSVFEPGVDAKGAIREHLQALERCREAGVELASD
jgi:multimeric flavodoxin WrbA